MMPDSFAEQPSREQAIETIAQQLVNVTGGSHTIEEARQVAAELVDDAINKRGG